jgi:hypothetical protein
MRSGLRISARRCLGIGAALALLASVAVAGPEPASGDYVPWFEARMDAMRPAPESWQSIDWQTDLQAARAEAARSGKPIFLWAMNGNPLGCT